MNLKYIPYISRYLMVFILFLSVSVFSGKAFAQGTEDARNFVDNIGKQVLSIINSQDSENNKQARLQEMFSQNVDIPWMAHFVMANGWRKATEEQRNRYLDAYKRYMLARYTSNFKDYTGSKYVITDSRETEDGKYTVTMKIKSPEQGQVETVAGYRLINENGQFKIIDIIIEGVSLITTQRSEFFSVYNQKGIDGLINSIEDKTSA
jgi:phospholipid transport system substrate-binding protein